MRLCNGARQTAFSSAVAGLSAVSDGHWFDLAETAMTLKKPAMVLIDVDGTLVDSVPDLAFCVDEMMRQLGRPARGESAVRNWVGNGVERLVRRALVGQLDGEPSEADFDAAHPIFLELYAANTSKRSLLYPGVMFFAFANIDSTVRRQDCAVGLLTGSDCDGVAVTGNYAFLPRVGRAPGRRGSFLYRSGSTDVMAWVLEAATGRPV